MNLLVSVIIPVYNVKPYLREALDSVISQTYKSLDIIIIDDGSTDGSEIICNEYTSDPRVTVVHQKNGGLSNARNTGLDLVKGDYICFLDPDDAYHPAFIETLLDTALSTQAEMVVCKFSMQKTSGKLGMNEKKLTTNWPNLTSGVYSKEDALRSLVGGDLNVSVWNKFYKKDLWSNVRFPDGHNHEDTDSIYRVIDECQRLSMVDKVLYYNRDRSGSITHNYDEENTMDWIRARSHLEEYVLANNPEIFDDALVARFKRRILKECMGLFAKCSAGTELRNELREMIMNKGRNMEQWDAKTRVAYLMVCYIPSFFRFAYKCYLHFRLFIGEVTGK